MKSQKQPKKQFKMGAAKDDMGGQAEREAVRAMTTQS